MTVLLLQMQTSVLGIAVLSLQMAVLLLQMAVVVLLMLCCCAEMAGTQRAVIAI